MREYIWLRGKPCALYGLTYASSFPYDRRRLLVASLHTLSKLSWRTFHDAVNTQLFPATHFADAQLSMC